LEYTSCYTPFSSAANSAAISFMISYSTKNWGYTILSNRLIRFNHVLLPRVQIKRLTQLLPHVQEIVYQKDNSIAITFASGSALPQGLQKLISFFDSETANLVETQDYVYKIKPATRALLKEWFLALEGCLALLLIHNADIQPHLASADWAFLDIETGGIQVGNNNLILYESHAKVLNAITPQTYRVRNMIEQKAAIFLQGMIRRVEDAQPGFVGLAMQSYVSMKTKIPPQELSEIIHKKSLRIQNPSKAPFFATL
jgi:hypothetical protein